MFLIEPDGTELPLKDAGTGESVHSLLSLMDAIIGQCGSTHEYSSISSIHVHVQVNHTHSGLWQQGLSGILMFYSKRRGREGGREGEREGEREGGREF